jgi:hypothetical protein
MQFTPRGELAIVDQGKVHVANDGRIRRSFEAPIRFGSPWCISRDGTVLRVGIPHGVTRFDLDSGTASCATTAHCPAALARANANARASRPGDHARTSLL